jgi:hypothetical protein
MTKSSQRKVLLTVNIAIPDKVDIISVWGIETSANDFLMTIFAVPNPAAPKMAANIPDIKVIVTSVVF